MTQSAHATAERAPRLCRFVVAQTAQGGWLARDRERHIARTFATRREAIHFALFETGARRAAVLLTPGD
jgi:hypothetical protein